MKWEMGKNVISQTCSRDVNHFIIEESDECNGKE